MSLSITPRDITFEFPNSCNSKCCAPQPSRIIYINSSGQLETYKHRKARNDTSKAFERSLSHLNLTLERKVTSFQGDPLEFQMRIGSIIESINALETVNLNHIEAINQIMLRYLAERSPKSDKLELEEPTKEPLENNQCVIL